MTARRKEMGEVAWAEYQRQRNIKKVLAFKERDPKRWSRNVMAHRRRQKAKLVEYKGGKCQKCGYDGVQPDGTRIFAAFDFHHVYPNRKSFPIAENLTKSLAVIKTEVDKCDLYCNRCHQELHALWDELRGGSVVQDKNLNFRVGWIDGKFSVGVYIPGYTP
jgi:hypothetical protein